MRMLIIGGSGMAGHLLVRFFRTAKDVELHYTTRAAGDSEGHSLDVTQLEAVEELVGRLKPDLIVNAVGILNQAAEDDPLQAYLVNGMLPHWLGHLADLHGARLIHISSDCVFTGNDGRYVEWDEPDGHTVYARTKALGEVKHHPRHLTIRTSIIGPEVRSHGIGLLHWFMQQEGTIQGYERVMWNGVTTLELAKAIQYAIQHPEIAGLVHLTAAQSVSKHDLLHLFRDAFGKHDLMIEPNSAISIDRTLVSSRDDWTYQAPGYAVMLAELASWMRGE
ncbi:dTDP-4-dehydrorhamnose reductase family protein [Paenibacillus sp. GCM10023252]|uniref:dTDP-4-dehydrorhamnose reductase family protein n=1 Tax=Paenibacillus sp. GCM10023252 TaxID=3252649 RepID=UPI003616E276